MIVTHKFRSQRRIHLLVDAGVSAHVIGGLVRIPRLAALLLHACGKSGLIVGKSLLLQDLPGQVHRESVGVIEPEGILPGEHLASGGHHLLLHLL